MGQLIQRADNYALASMLFAVSWFFAGISTRIRSPNAPAGRPRARLRAVARQRDLDRDVPSLANGQITVQGPFLDSGDSVLAITGGSGAYRKARGTMDLHARSATEFEFTFLLGK